MRLAELPPADLARRLAGPGLCLQTGPFAARLRSSIGIVRDGIALLYADFALLGDDSFCDIAVDIRRPATLRRWLRPQVEFASDGAAVFEPFAFNQALPLLEWGMNWCLGSHINHYLLIHAAVVERDGRALVLPAPPGSGKSTLCAGLVHRGWRLLSDETAVISFDGRSIWPLCRPVSLKNRSIDVIRAFAPGAVFGPPAHGTPKGTVIHVRAAQEHVARMGEPARPGWIVFPRWRAGAAAELTERPQADALIELCGHSFNYARLGRTGFDALAGLIDASLCHDFVYGNLDDAVAVFDGLAAGA
jgi:HprK-related kinase A